MFDPIMQQYKSIGYLIEVLLAELLFLHNYRTRDHFLLRMAGGMAVSLLLVSRVSLAAAPTPMYRFVHLLFILIISVLCMLFCYKGNAISLISSCVAGVAVQHIAYKLTVIVMLTPLMAPLGEISPLYRSVTEIIACAIVYTIVFFVFARDYAEEKGNIHLSVTSFLIVITCIGVNRLVADHEVGDVEVELAAAIYAIICCVFALAIQLYLQRWQREKSESMVIKGLLSASEKQYEQWQTMVELTNIQTHDLKHMLDRIENLADKENLNIPDLSPIRDSIESFSPIIKTGNEVIDVLLRNMGVLCRQQKIRLNYVSYTDRLGDFDSMQLYFLFANAIDNARAGAGTVTDPDKRLVDVSLKQFGDSVIVHVWNYYQGDIVFADELPVSDNTDSGHGFGLKSIRMITDRFGGAMKAYTEGDVFHLNIILPMKA